MRKRRATTYTNTTAPCKTCGGVKFYAAGKCCGCVSRASYASEKAESSNSRREKELKVMRNPEARHVHYEDVI